MTLQEYLNSLKNKTVAVIGIGAAALIVYRNRKYYGD